MVNKTDTDKNASKPGKAPSAEYADPSQLHAAQALSKIQDLRLKPIPQLYELWFRYFQGDPEITRAVNEHKGEMDEIACHKMYKRYLGDSARTDAVKVISDQIQQAISEMVVMLKSVQNTTTEYGGALDDVKRNIEEAKSIEDLEHVVSSIVKDTKKMLEKNQALELQLVNSSNQVTELKQNLDQVRKEATLDGLTGLSNRKSFDKYIRDAVEDATVNKTPLVLLILDIDHFKRFNDTYGHQVGDQVLRLVARTLTDGVKGRDVAARYGGEEFVILLIDTPLHGGIKVAEYLRRSVEGKEVINKASHENLGQITLSVGAAEYLVSESVTEFIARADRALYDAKNTGRNRVCIASPAPVSK